MKNDKPSSTAALIAAATVFANNDATLRMLLPADAAHYSSKFIAALPVSMRRMFQFVSHPSNAWLAKLLQRVTVPGLAVHFALRKRFIEMEVRSALAAGLSQVVVISAGFDTLTARLHRQFPSVTFIELDHAATQAPKRVAMSEVGHLSNLTFESLDVSQASVRSTLERTSWRPELPAVFVIEGLLMYLNVDQVGKLFTELSSITCVDSRVVFTLMEYTSSGRVDFHNATSIVRKLLTYWREPFQSAMYRAEIAGFLKCVHFRVEAIVDAAQLRARFLEKSTVTTAEGELVCVAIRVK